MKPLFLVLAAVGMLALSSCNSQQTAAVAGLNVELTALEQSASGATATVRFLNPNVVAYNVASATHRIYLGGRLAGTVKIDRPTGVPAQTNVAQQTGTLVLEGDSLPRGATDYRMESQLVLRLYGDTTQQLKLTSNGSVTVTQK